MHILCYKIEIGPIVALLGRKHLGHLNETKVYLQRTKTKASNAHKQNTVHANQSLFK